MVRRHSILNCTLTYLDGGWRYAANRASKIDLCVLDTGVTGTDAEADSLFTLNEFLFREFDLDKEGPLRIGCVRIALQDYFIGVAIHHSFTDVYSNRIFSFELAASYEALCGNRKPAHRQLPLDFFDYMTSVDEWAQGADAKAFIAYWLKYLQGAHLPQYRRTDELFGGVFTLPHALSGHVRAICAAERIGPNIFWEAVHHVALYRLLDSEDVTTLSVDVGRRQNELIGMMGQFVNLLPCRSRISAGLTLRKLMRELNRMHRESAPYRATPYDLIAERCEFSYASALGQLNFLPREFLPLPTLGAVQPTRLPHGARARIIYPYSVVVVDSSEFEVGCIGHVCEPFTIADMRAMLERAAISLAIEPDSEFSKLPL